MDSLEQKILCNTIYPVVLAPTMMMVFITPFRVQHPFIVSQPKAPGTESPFRIVHDHLAPFVMHLSNVARSFQ